MTRVLLGLVLAAGLSLAGGSRASAQLITLTKSADLGFGEAFIGSTLGTVVISAAGGRSASGGVTLGSPSGVAAARFTVSGVPLLTYHITLPSSTTLSSGGFNMTVDTFTSTPSGSGTLSTLGSATLTVGATLHVGASQHAGSYSGSFNVTVSYN